MADGDSSGGLSIPNTDNWSEWTFEQALKAVTGEGADFHTPAKQSLFTWNGTNEGGDVNYHAYGKNYYSVKYNPDAMNAWVKAIDLIDEMMPDVARGKRGTMDRQTLLLLAAAIDDFAGWSQAVGAGMHQWSNRLNSDDSAFRGKAAFLIYWRLKVQGDGLDDTYDQLTKRHGRPIAPAVLDAANELGLYTATMSSWWNLANHTLDLRNLLFNRVADMVTGVHSYLVFAGLIKDTPQYQLDHIATLYNNDKSRFGKVEDAKEYIGKALANFPGGDLTQQATWDKFSKNISDNVLLTIKNYLDTPAQAAIGRLAPKYVLATSSLIEIAAPPPQTAPKPDVNPPNGGGDDNKKPPPPPGGDDNKKLPPPPGGDDNKKLPPPPPAGGDDNTKLPPPPSAGGGDNGNLPPPAGGGDGGLNLPNGGGGADGLNLPNGGGGADGLNVPGGGPGGVNLADGSGTDGLNPPNGGGDIPADGGAGGFIPGLVPPGGGTDGNGGTIGKNGTGPGADGAFDENGLGNDLLKPPPAGGDGLSLLPDGSTQSNTHLPPDGTSGGGVNLGAPPKGGAGDGFSIGSSGFGSDPGKGFGSGANLLGTNGGAGNALGGVGGPGGSNGLAGLPGQLNGGSPGLNGAPGSSDGDGGVPFFPPMMGGAGGQGGGGESPKERERQTWLTEDEEIWGTRVEVRSGAIGRLEDEEYDVEEVPLAGPTRRQRLAKTPKRPRPDEKQDAAREATSTEEATGSA